MSSPEKGCDSKARARVGSPASAGPGVGVTRPGEDVDGAQRPDTAPGPASREAECRSGRTRDADAGSQKRSGCRLDSPVVVVVVGGTEATDRLMVWISRTSSSILLWWPRDLLDEWFPSRPCRTGGKHKRLGGRYLGDPTHLFLLVRLCVLSTTHDKASLAQRWQGWPGDALGLQRTFASRHEVQAWFRLIRPGAGAGDAASPWLSDMKGGVGLTSPGSYSVSGTREQRDP